MITRNLILLGLLVLAALSVQSVFVLKKRSPWTSAGWAASWLYCVVAAYEVVTAHKFAPVVPYGILAVMIAAFAVAGVKDEAQAEPWYFPNRVGRPRSESRNAKK